MMEMFMKKCICLLLTVCLFSMVSAQEETEYDSLLASDVNADGIINILDLVFVASHFGETAPAEDQAPNADVNGDGDVNILDLTLIASHFGKYSGVPLEITDKIFDTTVNNASLPILVEFHSVY